MANLGFLIAMMEPPAALESEFNDWYDSEHIPERLAVDGFLNARRSISVQGWPRYLAIYDLRAPAVLESPGYRAIAGAKYSPWTKRVLGFVSGLYRCGGEQIYPGEAAVSSEEAGARLVLIHFRGLADRGREQIVEGARHIEVRDGVFSARVFRTVGDIRDDYLLLVECDGLSGSEPGACPVQSTDFGAAAEAIDRVNTYVPYERLQRFDMPFKNGR